MRDETPNHKHVVAVADLVNAEAFFIKEFVCANRPSLKMVPYINGKYSHIVAIFMDKPFSPLRLHNVSAASLSIEPEGAEFFFNDMPIRNGVNASPIGIDR